MKDYSHIVEFNGETRILKIFRVYGDGSRVLFSETDLPRKTFDEDTEGFREFSRVLGENLLTDSPIARKILGI